MLRWYNVRKFIRFSHRIYTTTKTSTKNVKVDENLDVENKEMPQADIVSSSKQSRLVAAAFASLKEINRKSKSSVLATIDKKLNLATDVNTLLSIAERPVITKSHALKVVTILAEWTQDGKCELKDYETDLRFVKLCRILGRVSSDNFANEDLKIVLNVTADDQAAKLISEIDLPQMVKILSSLGLKKRRSIPLLRSLSFNIVKSSQQMNIKQAADVLYACASLNYVDDVLLEKTITDILLCLENNKKASVIKSIVNSLGILRYRHTDLLNNICEWFIKNKTISSSKELIPMLYTLANVNYLPDNFNHFIEILNPFLNIDSVDNNSEWVDIVWSLIVLDQYNEKMIDSVLNSNFVEKLHIQSKTENIAIKLKLLNINGYAKQQDSKYKGQLMDEKTPIFEVPLSRTKEEQVFFDSLLETISNLISVSDYVKTDVDSKMGFLIDAVVSLDIQRNFVKLSDDFKGNVSKVAIMICNYHDMCRCCHNEPTGITALIYRLIRNNGYKLLIIPHNEFNSRDKLITRINYLSEKLKILD